MVLELPRIPESTGSTVSKTRPRFFLGDKPGALFLFPYPLIASLIL